MNKLHLSFFGFFIFLFFPLSSLAATLSLSAPASSYKVGDTFTVTVGLNASASEQVVGVDIPALTFDATKLQVQGSQVAINSLALGPANKASTTVNSVNNNTGTVTFGMQYWADLANNPSFASGNVTLATISFRVTNTGSVTISTGSQALVASYSGANVLTGGPSTLALTLNPATVLDTQAPTVSITAPAAGAIVSGSALTLSATASDNIGVVGVRFRVDGVDITPEDTTPPSPFSATWNTTTLANGSSHIITAVARDAAGNTTTSAGITVYVNNSTSNKFVVGDQVQMNASGINVRGTPGGTSLGTQTINTIGTVVSDATYSSPTYALLSGAGYFWWKVNFATGFDGWVAEGYLTKYVSPTFDFSLSSGGGSPSVTAGSSVNNAIIVNTLAGAPQLVGTFSASGLPSGATASFSPLSCIPSGAPSTCQTTMTINSGTAAPVANKAVTVSAVSGSLTKTVTFNLTINAQADIQAPTAPSNVSATAVSSNQVNLSWTGSTDDIGVMGYRIYKDGVVLPQTTTATTYQITGLSGNTAYSFQIEAYDASGKATRSLAQTVTTPAAPDTEAPTVIITSLTAGQSVSGTIAISANASDTGGSGMTGVQFAIDGQSIGARDTLTPYSASWNSASVPNGNHQITATAYDAANNSASASVSVSVNNVTADTVGPVISNIAESGVTASGATASFNTDEPATYIIRYWVSGVNTLSFLVGPTARSTSHQVILSNLLPDTLYQYDILARDQAGNQTQSSVRNFKTAVLTVPDTTPPPAITNLALTNTSARSATVSWTAPSDTGGSQNSGRVASYTLAYAGFNLSSANWANARFAGGLPSPASPGTTETYTLIDLSPNTAYSVAIKSKDGAGLESPISNVISVTTSADNTSGNSGNGGGGGGATGGDNVPPGQVRDLKVKEFDKQISISWQNPADSDFIRTVVVKKEASAPASMTDGTKVYEASGTSYNDLNLENGKEYFYSLFAVDSSSNYSAPVTISARPKAGATQASETNAGATNTIPAGNQGTNTNSNNSLSPVAGPFSVGMRSEEVKVLQQILATDPSIYPEGVINGFYGPATVEAVKKFQAQYMGITNGSPTTNGYGLAGPSTRAKLNEVFVLGKTIEPVGSGANTPPVTTGGNVATSGLIVKGPFSVGIRSEEVKVLQRVLASDATVYPEGKVTGFYGPATTEAVKRFQNKYMGITNGSPSTNGYGLAGPSTRAKINEVFGGGAGQTSNLTPEQKAALIEELKKQIAELTQKITDLIAAQQAQL